MQQGSTAFSASQPELAPGSPGEDRLLTVQEVATRLRMHPESVRRWLREGRLKGGRMGGRRLGYRIPESEVERVVAAWIDDHATTSPHSGGAAVA